MPAPLTALAFPGFKSAVGAGLGSAIPYLLGGLFGGGDDKEGLSEEEKELLRLRAQFGRLLLQRQRSLNPLFNQVSRGIRGIQSSFVQHQPNTSMDLPGVDPRDATQQQIQRSAFGDPDSLPRGF